MHCYLTVGALGWGGGHVRTCVLAVVAWGVTEDLFLDFAIPMPRARLVCPLLLYIYTSKLSWRLYLEDRRAR